MSTHTPNFNLIKLELGDPADITQMNKNWDTIDEELEKCAADVPVTSEIPEESNIWIDPNEETVEDTHITDKNNPHGVTAAQIGAAPAIEDAIYRGCYYRMVDGVKEWINPPMEMDVEYRTSERHNGKVVYAQLVGMGTLPYTGNIRKLFTRGVVSEVVNMSAMFYDEIDNRKTNLTDRINCEGPHVYEDYIEINNIDNSAGSASTGEVHLSLKYTMR